jgi:hypothetical protein
MAGDWIKIDTILCDKPEVWLIAEKLDLDVDAVIGKLIRLWSWMDQHMTCGDAVSVTPTQLDALCRCEKFSTALADVGWLVIHRRTGKISIPNWDRHNGKTAKERALTRDRMKRSRDGAGVTNASPEKRREEKRKEEEKKAHKPASPKADRRGAGVRLEAAPAAPSAGEPAEKPRPPPTRSPEQRRAGLTHLSAVLRQVLENDEVPDGVRTELEAKPAIPIPTDEQPEPLAAASP